MSPAVLLAHMPSRRRFVGLFGVTLAGLSGCTSFLSQGDDGQDGSGDDESPVLLAASNDTDEVVLVRHTHVEAVGTVQGANGRYSVPVELTADGENAFYDGMDELDAAEKPETVELYTYVDGEVVHRSGITADFAERPDPDADSAFFYVPVPDEETGEELESRLEDS